MQNDKINNCINRVLNMPTEDKQPLSELSIQHIEKELGIILPNSFKRLSSACRYDYFTFFDFFNFTSDGKYGVYVNTKACRENYNLPNDYLVLFSDDVSFVLLKMVSAQESEVIWCDYQDFFNLCNGSGMKYNPTIFSTFTDFYEFLLDEEEKSRNDEKKQQTV